MEQLSSALAQTIDQLADKLSSELKIDKLKIVEIWNNGVTSDALKVPSSVQSKNTSTVAKPRATKQTKSETGKTCQYAYSKGANVGQMCGAKVADESTTGNFCKKHLGKEAAPKEKASKSVSQETKSTTRTKNFTPSPAVEKAAQSTPVTMIALNKYKRYEHAGTGLLFDRATEKVYGRQGEDGSILQLTVQDIEACKAHGFAYVMPAQLTSSLPSKKEDAEEADEEEEDDGEEEVDEEDDEEEEADDE